MTITTFLAIYGSVISTILLIFKVFERREQFRRFLLQLDRYYIPNTDQVNYHDGRKGDQYMRVRITNKSLKENSIAEAYFLELSSHFRKPTPVTFNFPFYPRTKFPIKLGYTHTEQIAILTPLNMVPGEFHQSWNSNVQVLQSSTSKYIKAIIVDTHGKRYYSNAISISKLIKEFIEFEEKIISENYRQNAIDLG